MITSIPYMVNKSQLVESPSASIIMERKIPQLVKTSATSPPTTSVSCLEVKRGTDPETIFAYLYKHTNLRSSFHVNMTCLVPDASSVGGPATR